jgi:hypothetical protein
MRLYALAQGVTELVEQGFELVSMAVDIDDKVYYHDG